MEADGVSHSSINLDDFFLLSDQVSSNAPILSFHVLDFSSVSFAEARVSSHSAISDGNSIPSHLAISDGNSRSKRMLLNYLLKNLQ